MSFYRATLTAAKPFSSFTTPGTDPTVVVNRRGAKLDAETASKLRAALRAGKVPNVKPEDVSIVEIDGPRRPVKSASAEDLSDDELVALAEERGLSFGQLDETDDTAELRDQLDTLSAENESLRASNDEVGAERDELAAKLETVTGERDAAVGQVETLEAQTAESDSAALATDILGSLTVPELRKLGETRAVEIPSSATKDEIIGALTAPPSA